METWSIFPQPSARAAVWRIVVTLAATAAAMIMPLRLVFGSRFSPNTDALNGFVAAIFIADAFFHLRDAGFLGGDRRTSLTRRSTLLLAADVIAAIPFDLFTGSPILRVLRLFKLVRVGAYMSEWHRRHTEIWNVLRLGFFAYWLVVCVNWLACGWLALRGVSEEASVWSAYVYGLYWCIQTLTTVGYGDETPVTDGQRLYAMGVMLVGVGVYGYVIGNVAGILTNLDPVKAEYRSLMERLSGFMRYRRIPPDLQQKIRDYYRYVWEKRLGYDESTILSGLPPSLQTELSLFLRSDVIERMAIFRGASEEFIRDVALQMQPVVFTPGDYVFRAGDPGGSMYFINRGTLVAMARDGETIFSTLQAGDFFGEIALLLDQPRSASVLAIDYCDLYRLDRGPFDRILARYPDFAQHIEEMTRERQERGT